MKQIISFLLFALLTPAAWAQGAFLGVELDSAATDQAAAIRSVQPRTAAALMGLEAGDVVLAIDQIGVESVSGLLEVLATRLPGEIVDVKVQRGEQELVVTGVLGRHPDLVVPLSIEQPWYVDVTPPGSHYPDNFVPFSRILPPNDHLNQAPWRVPDPSWQAEFEIPHIEIIPHFESFTPWDAQEGLWLPFMLSPDGQTQEWPIFDYEKLVQESMQNAQSEREVILIYPESTPEAQRQVLIDEAKAQYGGEAEVRFEGDATQISIQTRAQSTSHGSSTDQPDGEQVEAEGEVKDVRTVPVPPKSEREF